MQFFRQLGWPVFGVHNISNCQLIELYFVIATHFGLNIFNWGWCQGRNWSYLLAEGPSVRVQQRWCSGMKIVFLPKVLCLKPLQCCRCERDILVAALSTDWCQRGQLGFLAGAPARSSSNNPLTFWLQHFCQKFWSTVAGGNRVSYCKLEQMRFSGLRLSPVLLSIISNTSYWILCSLCQFQHLSWCFDFLLLLRSL